MSFYGEAAWEVEIDGVAVLNASDADGAPIGAFASKAKALGAQREVNLKKLLLMQPIEDDVETWGCEAVFDDETSVKLFAEELDSEWIVSESFDQALNERQVRSSKPF
ncbi:MULTISPECIES: hypothetical protein [Rhizobium]|uniref:hypothetical protein n=1 Tax=Rhizobium TaxID=379 RepID=UPI0007E535EF|nr:MULTISPECIES: hypothetical protein [Rhizobium]MBY3130068.1 hypothetical protein [Rhizobium laguerreae]